MRNVRYIYKLTLAYVHRFRGILIIGIGIGLLLFLALLYILPKLSPETNRIGINGRYYTSDLPPQILSILSEGLTRISEDGVVVPAIAESWETPDKGKTWIFRLQENLYWQDGTAISSESIHYDFSDVQIERPDERTIVFKLDEPFSPFPSIVSDPVFKQGLIGMKEWEVKNISVVGNYIERLELVDKQKNVRLYRFYPTIERTKLALKLGEVDSIENMYEIAPFEHWNTVTIEPHTQENQIVTLFFNTLDPLLSEKTMRQALAYAIDKDIFGKRAISSIPMSSWAHNPQVKPYEYDREHAQDLIDDMPDEAKKDIQIKLYTTPSLVSVADSIAQNWNDIGIPTTVQISTERPQEYQVFLTIYETPKDPDQYSIWHSTQAATNISKYASPRIDKLLEDGRTLIDSEDRRKVYVDFQRFLLEDLPAVFLYHPTYYTISRK